MNAHDKHDIVSMQCCMCAGSTATETHIGEVVRWWKVWVGRWREVLVGRLLVVMLARNLVGGWNAIQLQCYQLQWAKGERPMT